jgi:mRNA interferase RelE/StbE
MSDAVSLSPAAASRLRKFDPDIRRRIQAAVELLAENPRPPAATRLLGGAGEWRARTGDYRVIYEVHDSDLLVLVLRMAHRWRSTSAESPGRQGDSS